jgi:hypothetical protein
MAAKLTVHGGDFTKGNGYFYSGKRFLLRDRNGQPETNPLVRIEACDLASELTLDIFECDDALRADLKHATGVRERIFIAYFDDGRHLLASTDQRSFEQICGPRSPYDE